MKTNFYRIALTGLVLFQFNFIYAQSWDVNGNTGTNPSTQYVGTTDNNDLVFRTNGTEAFRISYNHNFLGIGLTSPSYLLDVAGDINLASNQVLRIAGNPILNNIGTHNIFVGSDAGHGYTSGTENSFVGYQAGYSNTSGSHNSFSGYQAGYSNTSANDNVFNGYKAGYSTTVGSHNVFSGYNSGFSNTSGQENVFLGYYTGYSNTIGSHNVFSGYNAGYSNTAGDNNVFLGYSSGYANTTGNENTFSGTWAGYANTTGNENIFSGYYAGYSNISGSHNFYSGYHSGYSNTTGDDNVSCGYNAGYSNTNSDNTFVGTSTGYYNTGIEITSVGYNAGYSTTTSDYSTYLGGNAGSSWDNGDANTFVGFQADANAASYTFSTALGSNATVTASNQVRIGDPLFVTSIGGQVGWTTLSDGRVKTNVQNNVPGLDFIKKLRPVTYNLDVDAIDKLIHPDAPKLHQGQKPRVITKQQLDAKAAKGKIVYTGFIAQEVEKAAKEVGYDFSGVDAPKNDKDIYGLRYAEFTVPIIKALQEIADENASLKKANDSLANVISDFNSRLSNLENSLKNSVNSNSGNSSSPTNVNQVYLEQNSPNPFTDNTVIKYFVPENSGNAKIVVTSDQGIEVMNFTINHKGNGSVQVSGNSLQIGSYSCTLIIDGKSVDVKKMILVR